MQLLKLGFKENKQFYAFLTSVMAGQIVYSAFEGFKGTFYDLMLQNLHITNTQLGLLFTLIGTAMFFYVPAGWVNNRFPVKWILFWGLGFRFVTLLVICFGHPSFSLLAIIAFSWGVLDAIFWPAVVNGVSLTAEEKNRGIAFGLLESIRRATEMGMNAIILLIMGLFSSMVLVFHWATFAYTLVILPMMFFVYRYAPNNVLKVAENKSKNKEAFKGLIKTLRTPAIWFAGITALTVYWNYINLIYTVPYLQAVFHISQADASIFGILNTGAMGVLSGAISGSLSDFVFKSPAKMMLVALVLTAIALVAVLLLPQTHSMLYPEIALLCCFSFASFLSKSIILAPISELNLPADISGSAMSVGSFLGYASVFWAYALNGWLIDKNNPIAGYHKIFTIGLANSIVGALCALLLIMSIRAHKRKHQTF